MSSDRLITSKMTATDNEVELAKQVIWAMGGKGTTDKTHAYLSESDYLQGKCLCGRGVKPHIRMEKWNLAEELVEEHTCPQCRERLKLLNFMVRTKKN